jgi:hypothetical protein
VQRLDPQTPTYLQVPVPTHLLSAVPGSTDTYIPVVPAVFRIRIQSGQLIRIWIDFQLKCWMYPDSVNPGPRHWVPVPTHLVSAPGSADTHIPIVLGLPGCAQVFPYLSPGPLDFWWYAKTNKPLGSRN